MNRAALVAGAFLVVSSVSAAADLPRCEKTLKLAHIPDPEPPPTDHMSEGTVLVEFTVDVSGAASDARIVESSNTRLNGMALKEAVRFRFVPPNQPCRYQMPIKFQVKD